MSVDKNAMICWFCGHSTPEAPLRVADLAYESPPTAPVWWNLLTYRDCSHLTGLACPDCMTKFHDMTAQQLEDYVTVLDVTDILIKDLK